MFFINHSFKSQYGLPIPLFGIKYEEMFYVFRRSKWYGKSIADVLFQNSMLNFFKSSQIAFYLLTMSR